MKVFEVVAYAEPMSPIGSDLRRYRVEVKSNGGNVYAAAYPKDEPDPEPVCRIQVKQTMIVGLEGDLTGKKGATDRDTYAAISEVLRAVCQLADRKNVDLQIHKTSLPDVKFKRFMERFGFLMGSDDYMKRLAGSSKPYHVI